MHLVFKLEPEIAPRTTLKLKVEVNTREHGGLQGSIHEGGELGYVLAHAFGAVFDNPDLIAVAVVGDGEAQTGPLAGSWQSVDFLNPARDGAVLPIRGVAAHRAAHHQKLLTEHRTYAREHFEDMQAVRNWVWTDLNTWVP